MELRLTRKQQRQETPRHEDRGICPSKGKCDLRRRFGTHMLSRARRVTEKIAVARC